MLDELGRAVASPVGDDPVEPVVVSVRQVGAPEEIPAVYGRARRLEPNEGPDVVIVGAGVPDDDLGVVVVRDGGGSAGARMIVVCGIVQVRKCPVVLLELRPVGR